MPVEDVTTVDVMGIEQDTGVAVLAITDDVPWIDVQRHLDMLERKINSYLAYSVHHAFHKNFPEAKGRKLKIAVYYTFEPPPEVYPAMEKCERQLQAHGIGFWFGPSGGDSRVQPRKH